MSTQTLAAAVNIHLSNLYAATSRGRACLNYERPSSPLAGMREERPPPPLLMPSSDKLPQHLEVKDNNDLHDRGRGAAEQRALLANQAALLCTATADKKAAATATRKRERERKEREPDFGIKRLKQKLPRSAACGSGGSPATDYELNKCNYISELMREGRRG